MGHWIKSDVILKPSQHIPFTVSLQVFSSLDSWANLMGKLAMHMCVHAHMHTHKASYL